MRIYLLTSVLLLSSACASSQCSSTIEPTDKVSDVQNKLTCLATENAKLRQDLGKAQQELSETGGLGLAALTPKFSTPEKCLSNTKLSAAKRGGTITAEGPGYIAIRLGTTAAVVVVCQSMVPAYIIVGGRTAAEANDLKSQLQAEIFPAN
jgi:hypothetical protein